MSITAALCVIIVTPTVLSTCSRQGNFSPLSRAVKESAPLVCQCNKLAACKTFTGLFFCVSLCVHDKEKSYRTREKWKYNNSEYPCP